MSNPSPTPQQILASSAGWVAALLNVVPGLGAGYLYQRRWKAYWITSALATAWFVAGAALGQNADAETAVQNQLVGLIGLLVLSAVTATEAGLAVKRVREERLAQSGLMRAQRFSWECLQQLNPADAMGPHINAAACGAIEAPALKRKDYFFLEMLISSHATQHHKAFAAVAVLTGGHENGACERSTLNLRTTQHGLRCNR